MAPNPWPARTMRSAGSRQQPRSLGRGEHVVGEGRRVVALGRGVGQAVPAQVHGDDAPDRAQATSDRRPRPGRVRQPVDEQDAGCIGHAGPGGLAGPPQSRKWIRSPGATSTTKPSGSAARSGGGSGSIAPRIRAPWPSAAGAPEALRPVTARTALRGARRGRPRRHPGAVRERARRGRRRHRRRAHARAAARERHRARRDAVRPVRGRAAHANGAPTGSRSRTGSRSSGCRSRRTSPTRTTSPTRSGSRSSTSSPTTSASTTTGSTSSASTDRRQSARIATAATRPDQRRAPNATRIGIVSQRNRRRPGADQRRVAIAAGPHVVEADRRVGQPDEHHDLRRDRDREGRVDQRAQRERRRRRRRS